MIRSLIGLSSLALIATKNNNRRKSLPQAVLPPARRQFGIQQYMTLPFQQRSKPGTIVNWAGSAARMNNKNFYIGPNRAMLVRVDPKWETTFGADSVNRYVQGYSAFAVVVDDVIRANKTGAPHHHLLTNKLKDLWKEANKTGFSRVEILPGIMVYADIATEIEVLSAYDEIGRPRPDGKMGIRLINLEATPMHFGPTKSYPHPLDLRKMEVW